MPKVIPKVAEARVLFTLSPEEALEVAQALVASRKRDADRILRPKKPVITVGILADALKAAGISDAKLIDPTRYDID